MISLLVMSLHFNLTLSIITLNTFTSLYISKYIHAVHYRYHNMVDPNNLLILHNLIIIIKIDINVGNISMYIDLVLSICDQNTKIKINFNIKKIKNA